MKRINFINKKNLYQYNYISTKPNYNIKKSKIDSWLNLKCGIEELKENNLKMSLRMILHLLLKNLFSKEMKFLMLRKGRFLKK